MDHRLSDILDNVPEQWQRSCLAPYSQLIDELRRRKVPYREIARILAEKCQLTVAWTTVIRFVHLRSQSKTARPDREPPGTDGSLQVDSNSNVGMTGKPPVPPTKSSDDEVWRRIEALKRRPIRTEPQVKTFQYNPDEPLRLVPKTGPEKGRK